MEEVMRFTKTILERQFLPSTSVVVYLFGDIQSHHYGNSYTGYLRADLSVAEVLTYYPSRSLIRSSCLERRIYLATALLAVNSTAKRNPGVLFIYRTGRECYNWCDAKWFLEAIQISAGTAVVQINDVGTTMRFKTNTGFKSSCLSSKAPLLKLFSTIPVKEHARSDIARVLVVYTGKSPVMLNDRGRVTSLINEYARESESAVFLCSTIRYCRLCILSMAQLQNICCSPTHTTCEYLNNINLELIK